MSLPIGKSARIIGLDEQNVAATTGSTSPESGTVAQDIELFQRYLKKFEQNESDEFADSIPHEMQEKLLLYFQDLAERQVVSMRKSSELEASGGCSLVPSYMQEKILENYERKVSALKHAIQKNIQLGNNTDPT